MIDNLNHEIEKFYENYQGASDLRSQEEKNLDYNQNEFVAQANPIEWREKSDSDWRSFPVQDQYYTSKCVAFTIAGLAMINYWLKTKEFLLFSPNSIYDYRVNKPSGGMIGDDAFNIWREKGISLEAVCKSNQVQETELITITNFAKEVAKGFKLGSYITISNGDFDRVASTIQTTGKGIMCWFFFTSREWSGKFPQVIDNLDNPYVVEASRHSVRIVDFGLIGGKEYLKVEDSAKFGGLKERWISREFFLARNFLIKYPMNFNYEDPIVIPIPTFKFILTLKMGSQNNEVRELQKYLVKAGFHPNNIAIDDKFGSITRASVIKFQKANGLGTDGIVGKLTRDKLNLTL